ncbi:MAG: hypothetical protein FWH42_02755 [Dehalococcoidia bacterium]|nr:hypothetical protein [Dehalococcoidia bacterium]
MKTITTKLISVLLPMAAVVSVLVAMPLMACAADQTVTIAQSDSVAQIQTKVSNAIDNTGGSGIVTVNGSKNNANGNLSLSIPSGVTVIWNANYAGDVGLSDLITFEGNGTFEIASGSIKNSGTSLAIYALGTATIKVSGGTISSKIGVAIRSDGSTVNINGGTISSEYTCAIDLGNSTVNINGGTISSENGVAIRSKGSTVNINSGTISSTSLYGAIHTYGSDSKINISGGFVFSYSTAITSTNTSGGAIYLGDSTPAPTIGGNAVICVWNQAVGTTTYTEGTTTDLVANTGASATWAKSGSQDGISYSNATNSGFFLISGIVVNA